MKTMALQRRTLWTGALAVTAAAAGAGLAWWRLHPRDALPPAVATFWASRYEGPNGEPVVMDQFRGRPLLVNFWATWCPPCVEELPLLNAFQTQHAGKGWQVLGLAVDQPSAVRQFLTRLPLVFPVGMAGLAGTDLSRSLGNLGGGLPFTVVFDAHGAVLHQKVGKVSQADLDRWAQLG